MIGFYVVFSFIYPLLRDTAFKTASRRAEITCDFFFYIISSTFLSVFDSVFSNPQSVFSVSFVSRDVFLCVYVHVLFYYISKSPLRVLNLIIRNKHSKKLNNFGYLRKFVRTFFDIFKRIKTLVLIIITIVEIINIEFS